MRRLLPLLAVSLVLAGCLLRRSSPPPSPQCRSGPPLVGVYHPKRLKVRSRCRVAVGTVEKVKPEPYDGDIHVALRLDPGQDNLLSHGNQRVGGALVVEIIPWDRSRVSVPEVGQRIQVVGPWVEDTAHGWNEIHPAWWISAGRIQPASADELRRADRLLRGLEPAANEDDG
jgi:hypothetical protein